MPRTPRRWLPAAAAAFGGGTFALWTSLVADHPLTVAVAGGLGAGLGAAIASTFVDDDKDDNDG